MISENDLKEMETLGLEEKAFRVEAMLSKKEKPRPFELGLYLALKMALELKNGQELGSTTSKIVASWMTKYPESTVEEAIALAKQFFVNPSAIAAKIKEGFLKTDA